MDRRPLHGRHLPDVGVSAIGRLRALGAARHPVAPTLRRRPLNGEHHFTDGLQTTEEARANMAPS